MERRRHWEDGRFVVCDGRHDYLAALMIGRDKLFVYWLEAAPEAIPDLRNRELVRALRRSGNPPQPPAPVRLRS
jgi:hypothetical protein